MDTIKNDILYYDITLKIYSAFESAFACKMIIKYSCTVRKQQAN